MSFLLFLFYNKLFVRYNKGYSGTISPIYMIKVFLNMIKRLLLSSLALLLLLSSCGPSEKAEDDSLSIVATTYPIYLFVSEVVKDVDGVTVTPLIQQDISCLHDYTLTVQDMKILESLDLLVINGAGLDNFILEATSIPDSSIIDCSVNICPFPQSGGHSHEGEEISSHDSTDLDPHFWMDPARAAAMLQTIKARLIELDPDHKEQYQKNGEKAAAELLAEKDKMNSRLSTLSTRKLITFHDGFAYFADAFGLSILLSVEEEEGKEASAQVISEAIQLIQTHKLPAIFTEINGSDSTANAIAREADVEVYPLSMIMSGSTENPGIHLYLSAMHENMNTILRAFQ